MAKVITEAAKVICPHGGTITFTASQQLLQIDDKAVLVQGDEATVSISGCTTTNASAGQAPCVTITLLAGMATSVTVSEKPVLLETATGLTSSTPPGKWSVVSAGQIKLDAV